MRCTSGLLGVLLWCILCFSRFAPYPLVLYGVALLVVVSFLHTGLAVSTVTVAVDGGYDPCAPPQYVTLDAVRNAFILLLLDVELLAMALAFGWASRSASVRSTTLAGTRMCWILTLWQRVPRVCSLFLAQCDDVASARCIYRSLLSLSRQVAKHLYMLPPCCYQQRYLGQRGVAICELLFSFAALSSFRT